MKNQICFLVLLLLLAGCQNADLKKLNNEKQEFHDKLQKGNFDYENALHLADSYKRYFDKYPDADNIPELTMELANISNNNLNDTKEAIRLYSRIIEDYPNYEEIPAAIFMLATIYHDKLKEYGKAKDYYNKLIDEFPNHYFVKDAKIMLENIGTSPEELFEEIMRKKELREKNLNQGKES